MPGIHFGFKVFFAESLETFVDDLRRARPTIFHSVPRLWLKFHERVSEKIPDARMRLLLKLPIVSGLVKKKILTTLGLDAARVALTGSAPVPAELVAWYQALGLELLEGYGMTENFAYCTISRPGRARPGLVGEAAPGVELKVMENSELWTRSPGMMKGYHRQPELSAEVLDGEGWLRTGDQAEIDAQGYLRITGRVKELFKTSKGKYIAPIPAENIINASGIAEQSCVMGVGLPQPFAVVMLGEGWRQRVVNEEGRREAESGLRGLLEKVNGGVEAHERLSHFVVSSDEWTIPGGMLTPTMKIQRQAIEKRFGPKAETWARSGQKVIWEAE